MAPLLAGLMQGVCMCVCVPLVEMACHFPSVTPVVKKIRKIIIFICLGFTAFQISFPFRKIILSGNDGDERCVQCRR